ncbi:hypothetical protein ABBQ32_011384 [Trebouxia sp. C0010 RCD-2024]
MQSCLPPCTTAYRPPYYLCFRSDSNLARKQTRPSGRRQCSLLPPRATKNQSQEQSPEDVQEAMLERKERNARRRRDSSSYRQTQQKQQKQRQLSKDGKPRWPEGQLFPDGWEEMGPFAKAWQIYAGERGALFWANKLAYTAVFVIVGGWILFRVVFPALGLYQLTNDISTPTKY